MNSKIVFTWLQYYIFQALCRFSKNAEIMIKWMIEKIISKFMSPRSQVIVPMLIDANANCSWWSVPYPLRHRSAVVYSEIATGAWKLILKSLRTNWEKKTFMRVGISLSFDHVRKWTDIRPFQCKICLKLTQKMDLLKHPEKCLQKMFWKFLHQNRHSNPIFHKGFQSPYMKANTWIK